MTLIAIYVYAAALMVANLLAAKFGPWVTPINAFVLIGLDLALRDMLHARLRWWQMALVILGSGVASWLFSPAAGLIAVAGAVSFIVAGLMDWAVFAQTKGPWLRRANRSNIAGAAVDSALFPLIAFGGWLPGVVLLQFVAKVGGGALWAYAIHHAAQAKAQKGESNA